MATNVLEIYNLTLVRLGEDRLETMTDDSEPLRKLDAIYDNVLEQVTVGGPEKGWKFAKVKSVAVDVESSTISSFADYSGTVAGTVLVTTSTAHNLVSGNNVSIEDSDYDDEYEATVVDTTSFYITATFVATGTGTAYWVSDEDQWRFTIPSASKRVVSVRVSGIELTDWTEEDGYILTGLESVAITIDYVKSVTDTTKFPAYFTKVLYMSLAAELAYSLLQSATAAERIQTEIDDKIMPKAIAKDEQKKFVEEVSTEWVDAGR